MQLHKNSIRRCFTKTGCGITDNGTDGDLIQPQRFKGDYTLGDGRILELQPEAVNQNTITKTDVPDDSLNPLSEDPIKGLEYGGNREVVNDDVGDPIDEDAYDTMEALEGGDFEYLYCPEDITSLSRGAKPMYLFMRGWEFGTAQPHIWCNNWQLKDFDAPHLVRYVEDGSYWLHDLNDRLVYLGKEVLNSPSTERTTNNDAELGSGPRCIINAHAADN